MVLVPALGLLPLMLVPVQGVLPPNQPQTLLLALLPGVHPKQPLGLLPVLLPV